MTQFKKTAKTPVLFIFLFLLPKIQLLADEAQFLFNDDEIPSFYITLPADSLEWLLAEENLYSDRYLEADMQYVNASIDTTLENVGFRLRGNTSRESAKKSFKISVNAFEDNDFYGLKKINLNGEHNDPTICRSKLNWDLMNAVNVPSSRCAHAKLYINNEYRGLYINVEEYNSAFLRDRFGNSNGNLYKCTFPADLTWLGPNQEAYKQENWGRRFYELKTNEEEDNFSDLVHFIDIINNTSDEEFEDSLETYFNTWAFLKVLASEVLVGHWDNYWYNKNNYFLYNNSATGKFEYIPYDVDNTYGIWWDGIEQGRDWGTEDVYNWGNAHGESRPLVDRMMSVTNYNLLYKMFVDSLVEYGFNSDLLNPRIIELREQISTAAEDDNYRILDYGWSYQDFLASFTDPSGQHVPYGLTDYVMTRNGSIEPGPFNWEGSTPLIPFEPAIHLDRISNILAVEIDVFNFGVTVPVELVVLDGEAETAYEMSEMGTINEGVLDLYRYVLDYPLDEHDGNSVEFFFRATNSSGSATTCPRFAPEETFIYQVRGVCINEFLASNDDTNEDEFGENDDWVELFNYFSEAIDLNGYYLTDDPGNPDKWAMPDRSIQPGEHLVIWADDDEEQGIFHTSFKLSADGEFIGLSIEEENGFTFVDSLSFGPQETDISWGRYPDAGQELGQMIPSPGAANTQLGVDEKRNTVPSEFRLYPPYPNPFNAVVVIRYNLPMSHAAKLRIVNIEGKTIEEKVLAGSGGKGSFFWNAEKYSSGIYFIQLISGSTIKTAKVVLLK